MSKQSLVKTVYTSWRGYNFCGSPEQVITAIQQHVAELPVEAHDVCLIICTEADYDRDVAVIDVSYKIPYTKEELLELEEREKANAQKERDKKLALYNQLKKEFE